MTRQRWINAGLLVAACAVVAYSGDAQARHCRCRGGYYGWRNSGYNTYAATPTTWTTPATNMAAPATNAAAPAPTDARPNAAPTQAPSPTTPTAPVPVN